MSTPKNGSGGAADGTRRLRCPLVLTRAAAAKREVDIAAVAVTTRAIDREDFDRGVEDSDD